MDIAFDKKRAADEKKTTKRAFLILVPIK